LIVHTFINIRKKIKNKKSKKVTTVFLEVENKNGQFVAIFFVCLQMDLKSGKFASLKRILLKSARISDNVKCTEAARP